MEVVNLAAFAVLLGLAATLAFQVLRRGTVSLWNGFLYADALSALVCSCLLSWPSHAPSTRSATFVRMSGTGPFMKTKSREGAWHRQTAKYYTLTPLFVFSMLLVALANNLGVMWVAIEGTTLASVFLVTFYGRETRSKPPGNTRSSAASASRWPCSARFSPTTLLIISGTDTLAGLNWSVLVGNAAQLDKRHAAGVYPYSAGIRNEGGHGADAHMETGCV